MGTTTVALFIRVLTSTFSQPFQSENKARLQEEKNTKFLSTKYKNPVGSAAFI